MGETPDIMKIIALIGVLAFTVEMTYHVYMECRYRRKLRQKAKTRSRTQFYIDIGPGEEIVVDPSQDEIVLAPTLGQLGLAYLRHKHQGIPYFYAYKPILGGWGNQAYGLSYCVSPAEVQDAIRATVAYDQLSKYADTARLLALGFALT